MVFACLYRARQSKSFTALSLFSSNFLLFLCFTWGAHVISNGESLEIYTEKVTKSPSKSIPSWGSCGVCLADLRFHRPHCRLGRPWRYHRLGRCRLTGFCWISEILRILSSLWSSASHIATPPAATRRAVRCFCRRSEMNCCRKTTRSWPRLLSPAWGSKCRAEYHPIPRRLGTDPWFHSQASCLTS